VRGRRPCNSGGPVDRHASETEDQPLTQVSHSLAELAALRRAAEATLKVGCLDTGSQSVRVSSLAARWRVESPGLSQYR
jgi:hypothetical protein